jgi:prepilin-type N-terminal cleavage/methylation domain-containing protein
MAARQTITGFARRGAVARGFTLIELLVVMGIIVALAAFAVPTYHFIMGNRSLEAAENMIAAMVGQARSQAISSQRYAGLAFFYNPATGRSSMAIVKERAPGSVGEEDPYINYKGWSPDKDNPSGASAYRVGDEVLSRQIIDEGSETRLVFRQYHAKADHQSSNSTKPVTDNAHWRALTSNGEIYVDMGVEGEIQPLPAGVGVQLINDPQDSKVSDRYVRTGVILFDAEGRLVSKEITIDRDGDLGRLINGTTPGVNNPNAEDIPWDVNYGFRSQLGAVLYDQETFRSQGWTEQDMIATANLQQAFGKKDQGELDEELWLDQNATQLLFSRHTGTVLRGE